MSCYQRSCVRTCRKGQNNRRSPFLFIRLLSSPPTRTPYPPFTLTALGKRKRTHSSKHKNIFFLYFILYITIFLSRSQWPRSLRCRSAAACLLRLCVRIPPGAWTFVCCELPGRGLCDELITRPEESYRLWCVVVCDLETS